MEQYFSQNFESEFKTKQVTVKIAGKEFEVTTGTSVFSQRGIDKGTQILLDSSKNDDFGAKILDLGCGWGPISIFLALNAPKSQIIAVDSNPRALQLMDRNISKLGLQNIIAGTQYDQTVDAIYSNPPIRIGKQPLYALLEKYLNQLSPGGSMKLVVQKNLGAESLLSHFRALGFTAEAITKKGGFWILKIK